jgi:hypothetical protein
MPGKKNSPSRQMHAACVLSFICFCLSSWCCYLFHSLLRSMLVWAATDFARARHSGRLFGAATGLPHHGPSLSSQANSSPASPVQMKNYLVANGGLEVVTRPLRVSSSPCCLGRAIAVSQLFQYRHCYSQICFICPCRKVFFGSRPTRTPPAKQNAKSTRGGSKG